MKDLRIIETELGKIYVIIDSINNQYEGKLFDSDMNINIITPTLDSCLEGLKNAFEIQMHFWLYKELLPINIDLRNE